jgi:signal transduction histidine kinase
LKNVALRLITIQEDERRRISQDLHDDIGQRMTGLILNLRSIKNSMPPDHKAIINQLDTSISDLEITTRQLRQIFYQLYPPSLNKMALTKVLSAFCTSFAETNRLRIDFSCKEEIPTVSNVYATAIYRFIQEGLTNSVKHANATAAWVNLDATENEISVSLEDNGTGFDVRSIEAGMGLTGIRERFYYLNGIFEIESSKDRGTRLFGSLPINHEGV